jgi:hypothetical protein
MKLLQRSALGLLLATVAAPGCGSARIPAAATATDPPSAPATQARATTATPPASRPGGATARFDYVVRDDYFAGVKGDEAAFTRAVQRIEDALAMNPLDPQPLMWHAMATGFLSGKAYRQGDTVRGHALEAQGGREAEQAVTLAPDDAWVLVFYGMDHSTRARFTSDAGLATRLLEQAAHAYERTQQLQAGDHTLSVHERGELIMGLADIWRRRNDETRARMYLTRATTELPGTVYATKAQQWLDQQLPLPPLPHGYTCLGCHE